MLAKIWKKLLLAICIIAILFNITAKLVNRISLEKAISSTPDGVNLREVLNITEEPRTTTGSNTTTNTVSRYKTVEEVEAEKAALEQENQEAQSVEVEVQEVVPEETTTEETVEEPATEEKETGGSIIDRVTESITNVKKYDNILN